MIPYRKITIEDREWMQEKLHESDFRGSEYCFANQFLWGNLVHMEAALAEDMLCTCYHLEGGILVHDFPVGAAEADKAIRAMMQDDAGRGCKSRIRGILEPQKEWMEQAFPGQFTYAANMEEWDYLYPVEAIGSLKGKRYHGKRNHIARFKDQGDWSYERMGQDNMEECRAMYENWLAENKERMNASMEQEKSVVEGSFRYFKELGLKGGVLRSGGRVAAFCIGEPLNSDTFIVHIEKAYSGITGAYPMINQQFVQKEMEGFAYVNREDDLGIEGLRKAKLSYHPDPILKKYTAEPIEGRLNI